MRASHDSGVQWFLVLRGMVALARVCCTGLLILCQPARYSRVAACRLRNGYGSLCRLLTEMYCKDELGEARSTAGVHTGMHDNQVALVAFVPVHPSSGTAWP